MKAREDLGRQAQGWMANDGGPEATVGAEIAEAESWRRAYRPVPRLCAPQYSVLTTARRRIVAWPCVCGEGRRDPNRAILLAAPAGSFAGPARWHSANGSR